jgi:hypothetical protein
MLLTFRIARILREAIALAADILQIHEFMS